MFPPLSKATRRIIARNDPINQPEIFSNDLFYSNSFDKYSKYIPARFT